MNNLFNYIIQPTIPVYIYNNVPIVFSDDWFQKTMNLYTGNNTYEEIAQQLSNYIYITTGKQELIFMVLPHDNIRELQWNNQSNLYYDVDTNLII